MVVLSRVDARLIHGQVAAIWLKYLNASTIVVVSDSVAADPFMKELYSCAVPDPNVKVRIFSIAEAVDYYKSGKMENGRVMVIYQNVETAEKAYVQGMEFKELDLGQAPSGAGKKKIYLTFYVTDEEEQVLQGMKQRGISVYCQGVPDDKKVIL